MLFYKNVLIEPLNQSLEKKENPEEFKWEKNIFVKQIKWNLWEKIKQIS